MRAVTSNWAHKEHFTARKLNIKTVKLARTGNYSFWEVVRLEIELPNPNNLSNELDLGRGIYWYEFNIST